MAKYRKILVAIDLSEEAKQVLEKAVGLSQDHNAELLVAHIVEPASIAYGGVYMIELGKSQDDLNAAAKERLTTYAKEYNIEASQQIVAVGHPHTEIHRLAKEHDIDLIVIGSHGRRGLQLFILGSTANGVIARRDLRRTCSAGQVSPSPLIGNVSEPPSRNISRASFHGARSKPCAASQWSL